ncbi:hypothetical protein BOTBODRAFT_55061 [Botryobasidium botryosum FD-172 SS1]|uniref:Peptidase A1 domain-containing protein n=1 Tax=Botryobasidium botryosum (strain FD-172 SS1) TaxID=930990 RepID=A0A067MSR3_BOTB1|nr:hypothetical protein BOTBODRAFT_55061 [Botryobasidium botryosum FD-172 SS1]
MYTPQRSFFFLVLLALSFAPSAWCLEIYAPRGPSLKLRPVVAHRNSSLVPSIPARAFTRDVRPLALTLRKVEGAGIGSGGDHALSARLAARGTVGVVAATFSNQLYNVLLAVGAWNFQVALDTASSDFWLLSSTCSTAQCKGQPLYPSAYYSPTFVGVNSNLTAFNESFADGSAVQGFVARETVSLAGFQVPQQALALVQTSNSTLPPKVSGLLGLGFPRLSGISRSTSNAPPIISSLVQSGQLAYPLFGLSVAPQGTSTLSLGAIDSSVIPNVTSIEWLPVVPFSPAVNGTSTSAYLQWAVQLASMSLNGTAIPLHPTYPNITGPSPLALFDIGTSGIYGPYQDVAQIFARIQDSRLVGDGVWAIPCAGAQPLTLVFQQKNITIQPSDMLIGVVSGTPNMCLSWPVALAPSSDGIDWQFGSPFLKNVYSIFSYGIDGIEPPMIGLYPLSNVTTSTQAPQVISQALSAASATVYSTLPNVLLPAPTYTTPPYLFDTLAPSPTLGQLPLSEMGVSTYKPLITAPAITYLPTVSPPPSVIVVNFTDRSGVVHVSTSMLPHNTAVLGRPSGSSRTISLSWTSTLFAVSAALLCSALAGLFVI